MGFNVSDLQITTATTSGVLQALGGFKFPSFTTATRPSSPSVGQTIYNTDVSALEVYDGSAWEEISSGGAFATWAGTGNRPSNPANYTVGYNTTDNQIEVYDGSDWIPIALGNPSVPITATGGNNTYEDNGWKYHVFTSDGTFTVTAGTDNVEYVIVAGGGGGGGGDVGAGGGAGGYRSNVPGFPSGGGAAAEAAMSVSPGSYPVVVGDGGTGSASSPQDAGDGADSSFNGITSIGGGGGASWGSGSGRSGGSGGGSVSTRTGASGTGAAGTGVCSGMKLVPPSPPFPPFHHRLSHLSNRLYAFDWHENLILKRQAVLGTFEKHLQVASMSRQSPSQMLTVAMVAAT